MTSSTSPFTDGKTGSQHTLPSIRQFRSGKTRIGAWVGSLPLGSLSHSAEVQYTCTLYASVFIKFFWPCSFCSKCSHTVPGTNTELRVSLSTQVLWLSDSQMMRFDSGNAVALQFSDSFLVDGLSLRRWTYQAKASGLQFMYLYWQINYQKFSKLLNKTAWHKRKRPLGGSGVARLHILIHHTFTTSVITSTAMECD